ncbi:MAG: FAA hydrolase family protein [Rhodospirillales bacterium]|nr:FAA hydrolase family protein [Rhodospirillales bacterium]
MRLVSFQRGKERRIGALIGRDGDKAATWIVDFAAAAPKARSAKTVGPDATTDMLAFLQGGRKSLAQARATVKRIEAELARAGGKMPAKLKAVLVKRSAVRLLAPVPRPDKFICVGLNFRDHAKEANLELPTVPVYFSKFPNAVIGTDDPIVLPRVSKGVDYEGEFAFVIGRRGRNIPREQALAYVAGYTIVNDVSARDFQKRTSQWLAGKSFDSFGVMGPALVTADEIPDPHRLALRTWVDGELRQNSNTNQLIFRVEDLIADMSRIWTLEPGDIISTGTPSGVGAYFDPPKFLKPGSRVRIEIDGLGSLESLAVAEKV